MPYFVFRAEGDPANAGALALLDAFDAYRDARSLARASRKENPDADPKAVRVVFAETAELAEALLRQPREAPILKEWEK